MSTEDTSDRQAKDKSIKSNSSDKLVAVAKGDWIKPASTRILYPSRSDVFYPISSNIECAYNPNGEQSQPKGQECQFELGTEQ